MDHREIAVKACHRCRRSYTRAEFAGLQRANPTDLPEGTMPKRGDGTVREEHVQLRWCLCGTALALDTLGLEDLDLSPTTERTDNMSDTKPAKAQNTPPDPVKGCLQTLPPVLARAFVGHLRKFPKDKTAIEAMGKDTYTKSGHGTHGRMYAAWIVSAHERIKSATCGELADALDGIHGEKKPK